MLTSLILKRSRIGSIEQVKIGPGKECLIETTLTFKDR